tara:strand:- start:4127 stop:4273 length:147 start_codon:yes stop_codon:yes gene_type:complete
MPSKKKKISWSPLREAQKRRDAKIKRGKGMARSPLRDALKKRAKKRKK